MRILRPFLILTFFSSFCFGQTKQEIIAYLKTEYTKREKIGMGGVYYDEKDTPILFVDEVLKKAHPELSFYIFILNQRECYGFSKKQSILIVKNNEISFSQFGLGLLANDFGFSKQFVNLFTNMELKTQTDFEEYITHIAKLLYSTYYELPYEMHKPNESMISFNTKSHGSVIFTIEKQRVKDVIFRL